MKLNFITDIKKSGKSCNEYDGIKYYVDTGNVQSDSIIGYEAYTYESKPSRANLIVEKGDVLFAKMQNSIKVVCIDETNEHYIFSTGFYCVSDKRVLPKYLKYFLMSKEFNAIKDKYCQGATMKAINDDGLRKICIEVPTIEEQQKIVDIFDSIFLNIKEKNNQINLYDELVKSRFVELFGNVSDFVNITDIAHTYIGLVTTMTKHYCNNGTPLLFNSSIKSDKIVWDGTYLDMEFAEANKSRMHKTNDIITVHTGDIGTSAVVGEEFNNSLGFATIVTRINDISRYYPRFVSSFLNYGSGKEQLKKYSRDVRNNLNLKDFNRLMVPNVSVLEQKRYVDFVEQTDKSKLATTETLKYLEELKDSLMNKYFGEEINDEV